MFSCASDYVKVTECGEFEVAQGISSAVFKVILVCFFMTVLANRSISLEDIRKISFFDDFLCQLSKKYNLSFTFKVFLKTTSFFTSLTVEVQPPEVSIREMRTYFDPIII